MAALTPLPARPADVASNGHNGHGALHDATASYVNGHSNGLANGNAGGHGNGHLSAPDTREERGGDLRALEAEALADPLVREFITALPAKLVEVRPLGPENGS